MGCGLDHSSWMDLYVISVTLTARVAAGRSELVHIKIYYIMLAQNTWSSCSIHATWDTTIPEDVYCDTAFVSDEYTQSSNDNSCFCDAVCISRPGSRSSLCPTHHIIFTVSFIDLFWLQPLN